MEEVEQFNYVVSIITNDGDVARHVLCKKKSWLVADWMFHSQKDYWKLNVHKCNEQLELLDVGRQTVQKSLKYGPGI